jgi:molybdate transport system permease protein
VPITPLSLSFGIASVATLLAAVIGIGVAAWLSRTRFWGRDVIDVITTAPMVLPPTVLGYYALTALGRRSAIGAAWEAVFGSSLVFSRQGAVVAAMLGALPIVIKSARAALEGVDSEVIGAARTLGASATRAFFAVELPLALRGIAAGLMLAFARSLGDFGVTLMIAGDIPGETQTASLAIYDAIQAHRDGDALVLVLVLSAVALTLLYVGNKLSAQ